FAKQARVGRERRRHAIVVGDDAAVVQERQRDERPAEQPAPDEDERQHTLDPAVHFRGEIERPVPEHPGEHVAPFPGEMRARAAADKRGPVVGCVLDSHEYAWRVREELISTSLWRVRQVTSYGSLRRVRKDRGCTWGHAAASIAMLATDSIAS